MRNANEPVGLSEHDLRWPRFILQPVWMVDMLSGGGDKPTEPTYSADLAAWIEDFSKREKLPFTKVKVEMSIDKKRADIIVWNSKGNYTLVIEVKRPEIAPDDPSVVKQAFEYARQRTEGGLNCFATHNVNQIVLWDAITGRKIRPPFAIAEITSLEEYLGKIPEIKQGVERFLLWYASFLVETPPHPIDEAIVQEIHSRIESVASSTSLVALQVQSYISDSGYREKFHEWLLDKGWTQPAGDRRVLESQCRILAKQFLYIFVNKILFYNVLRLKHPGRIMSLDLSDGLTGDGLYRRLDLYFDEATKESKDYETIFKTNFVDRAPLPNDAVQELVKLSRYLMSIDYSNIGYDIIGRVFEKLIPTAERHVLGQYFTPSDLVDVILSFCVRKPDAYIMDPACGSGTFLIRGYYRLKYLNHKLTHTDMLTRLWGVDISKFPAHLSTINLAIRNLADEHNYPNVIYRDFFDIPRPHSKVMIGMQSGLSAWLPAEDGGDEKPHAQIETLQGELLEREIPLMNAIVGNPPYTRQEDLEALAFGEKYKDKLLDMLKQDAPGMKLNRRSGIYSYFFPHAARFLDKGGRLGFVCLRSWLDTAYGAALERFLLDHFRIVAIIESEDKWFGDAQMLPVVVILEASDNKTKRETNIVRFVRLRTTLSDFIPAIKDDRDLVEEIDHWEKVDAFTQSLEKPSSFESETKVKFLGKDLSIINDDKLRIVSVEQGDLAKDSKWGKYLSAPSIFFKLLDVGKRKLVRIEDVAEVRLGTKTGANEFFCLPNKFFAVDDHASFVHLVDKGTGKRSYAIEKEFLMPVVTKIKPHRQICIADSDGYILCVPSPRSSLARDKKDVLDYINYGETKPLLQTRGKDQGKAVVGYHTRPSTSSRAIWYDLGLDQPFPIIFPSIFWARHLVFWNQINAFPTNAFFEIRPRIRTDDKVMCALLNSSFTAFMVEFSGRYIENRDATISNQIMVYEVGGLPVVDPSTITNNQRNALERELESLMNKDIGLRSLYDETEIVLREPLDRIVFCDILGLSVSEMKKARTALAEIVRSRIERLGARPSEEEILTEGEDGDEEVS